MLNNYITKFNKEGQVILNIKVKVNSPITKIIELMDNKTIKLGIKAVPEKGKANLEIIGYFAKIFKVEKENITIMSGKTSSRKIIKIKK